MRRIELSPPPFKTNDIAKFESLIAKECGVNHALAVSSGTAAIHLALKVLGIGPGDTVLCPTFTFIATANPILYSGATPVFIGCDKFFAMDAAAFRRAMGNHRPKAAIVASLYGDCPGYVEIRASCERCGIPMIEDACESLGASNGRGKAGSFGDVAAISFNLNKIVTAGGGGALVSNSLKLIEEARKLATQAKDPAPYYLHSSVGYNYRMPVPAATVGIKQIGKLKSLVSERRRINRWYRDFLPDWFFTDPLGESTHWLTTGYCQRPAKIIEALAKESIEARRMWNPLHLQPVFKGYKYVGDTVPELMFDAGICLPSRGLKRQEVAHICDIIKANL